MMAAEAAVEGQVDVSANEPSPIQPPATTSDLQNVDQPAVAVNGSIDEIENKQIADIVDELVNSAEASVSGGSDTELSKADPKLSGDKGHVRSSSAVKKPQSFKAVSVNRTFLAPKAAPNSTSRPESVPGSASATPQPTFASSASRLKLVAKSGSSLGGASKTLSTNGKTSGAPDPNLVWNRNRAPTQPEAKKRSDEELKNDGIHMADRLGPEDLKGQSNWADIEDDEEWVPETITWTDGTKITLPQADEIPPVPVAQPTPVNKDPVLLPKPKSPTPPTNVISPSSAIKPGVLASGRGLIFKGASEKPTLVAKPPAPPGPAKSPWAALPPVDKVSPVIMELPNQMPPRYPLHETSNVKGVSPPPTKEIAADDFSRNYRDGSTHSNRELYNSHSGRLEPVADRRGSRNEIYGRQPAVLQRPSHGDQQGPAEPSAAFQTSRTSGLEGPYARRRGSSNVSGGSGNLAHRLGGKPHDLMGPGELAPGQEQLPQSRAGAMYGSAQSPVLNQAYPSMNNHPSQRANPPPYPTRPSPHQTHAVPHQNVHAHESLQGDPNLEKDQKEFMKKRREEAIRRRQEEEAREEEARKARIAEKLKAMGPAPERKSAKVDVPNAVQRTELPASLAARTRGAAEMTEPAPIAVPHTEIQGEKKPFRADPVMAEVLEADVQPMSDRRINGSSNRPHPSDLTRMPPSQQSATPAVSGQTAANKWPEAPQHPDRFQTWAPNHQNARGNVWAAPGNDRSLGNGTFNADIGPLTDSHAGNGSGMHRPAPIAPPRPAQAPQTEPHSNRLAPIGPPRTQANAANPWQNFDPQAEDARLREEILKQKESLSETAGPALTDTWRPVTLDSEGRRIVTSSQSAAKPDLRNDAKTVLRPAEAAPAANVVPPTGPAAQTRTGSRFFPASKDKQQEDISSQQSVRPRSPTPPPPTAAGHPAYDGDSANPHVLLPPSRPRVRLPPSAQPSPPGPIAPPVKQAPVSFAAAVASNVSSRAPEVNTTGRPVSRGRAFNTIHQTPHEIASQENWQSRINNLMGKKSTSPFKPAATSMMGPIEFPRSHDSMDVPILSPSGTDSTDDSGYTSREMAEECFGEQEMGSLPPVRLPTETPAYAWEPVSPNWHPVPMKLRVDPTGSEPFKFPVDLANPKTVIIRISAPGMVDAKTVTAPLPSHRSGSNPRRSGPRTGNPRHVSRGGRRGGRDSSEHLGDNAPASSTRNPSDRGRGGGYRSRTENWSRRAGPVST
ncbi:hypothetical protein F5Y16DRAFT_24517 [Xylariaceae sp. FL0255]|nr:hypothetical protein F5Y16DRAFT_24517 [Xylariaceae sp. FL0255]